MIVVPAKAGTRQPGELSPAPASKPSVTLPRIHYAFIVAGVTFMVLLIGAGMRAVPGVFVVPFETEFGWSRATISLAVGVCIGLYGLTAPFSAAIMDRFGVRGTMLGALTSIGIALALLPLMTKSWHLIALWGVMIGLGIGFVANVLAAIVATRWFVARRGVVMGVLTSATAAGQLLFLPPLAIIAATFGWRAMAMTLAVAVVALIPLVFFLMRDRPEDLGLKAYGETGDSKPPERSHRQSDPQRVRRAPLRPGQARLLPARRHVLRLRRLDQRADRHASGAGLHRQRHSGDHGGEPARLDGDLQLHRRHRLRLPVRPRRLPHPALRLLRAARAVAAVPAVLVRHLLHAVAVRGVLRARLDRHHSADREADRPDRSAARRPR